MHKMITLTLSQLLCIRIEEFRQTSSKLHDLNRVAIEPKKKVLRTVMGKFGKCFELCLVFATIWKTIAR